MSEEPPTQMPQELFRSYYRSNFWLHIVFLAMSLGVILCSVLMTVEGSSTVRVPGWQWPMPESCMSRRVWRMDCPGCGLTRSFISMGHGEFQRAFSFNLAGPLVYLFVLVQIPWHAWQLSRILKLRRPVESLWLYVPLYAASAAILGQWLWRLCSGDLL